ncbi:UDP-galactose transmembrane transporter [Aureococcus anophagefferens]|nr:UDP-galactose transmembrane transporter [Aureococcus anophagefferens]
MGGGAPPAKAEELATPVVQGLLSVGVLCCFSVSSLTQEALTSKRYGAEEAPFHFKNFLLFAHARRGDGERHYARWVVVVGAYYASHWLGLASLHHLSYPVRGLPDRARVAVRKWTLMLHMSAWQGLLSYATCWSNGDEASRALAFVRAHPDVSLDLGAFLVSKALGTLCVYKLLRESGTIVVATITTLRKVLSVLLSVAIFGHAVGPASARRRAPPNAMARTSVESMLKTLNLMAYYDNFKIERVEDVETVRNLTIEEFRTASDSEAPPVQAAPAAPAGTWAAAVVAGPRTAPAPAPARPGGDAGGAADAGEEVEPPA